MTHHEPRGAAYQTALPVDPALHAALGQLARSPRLLVSSDYDGVLAPIVADPAAARPLPGAISALRQLAELPGTAVALISGRSRADLAERSGLSGESGEVRLVGGHGAELAEGLHLTAEQAALHQRLARALAELVARHQGVWLESKPASLVVHTRPATPEVATAARSAAMAGPGSWPGVTAGTGKEVVELSVVPTDKGTALTTLRKQTAADAVVFLGDDVTDENAFAVLGDGDVGVKVGEGPTRARFRVPDPPAALRVLELLLAARGPTPG